MKKFTIGLIIVIAVFIVFLMMGPFYIINEGNQVVVTRFGEIVETHTEAGLYFKIPFIDIVTTYPKLILSIDGDSQRIPTKENQFIIVDTTSRWKISDPALFYQSFKTLEAAYTRLSDVIDSATRTIITQNRLSEIVRSSNLINEEESIDPSIESLSDEATDQISSLINVATKSESVHKGRRHLTNEMAIEAQKMLPQYGIELIAWSITPALNATGRLGSPEISLELLLETEQKKRNEICESIIEINNKRKELGNEAWGYAENAIFKSLDDYHQNIVVIYDERIHRGVTGIIAARVSQLSNRPAFILTSLEDSIIGSVRSNKNLEVMPILNQCSDLFTNFGGHAYAAGFGMEKEKLPELLNRLKTISSNLEITDVEESLAIDAQLQEKHLTQEILKTIDLFEPYGEENPPLLFASDKLKILNADILGKVEPFHLKLTLAVDKTKWPALFWRESKRLKRDFDTGDKINLAYTISRNTFNGMESLQMIVSDIQKP
jgi:hypothetical protein